MNYYGYGSMTTLSMIDLAELKGTVPAALTEFGNDLQSTLTSDHYMDVANARSTAKEFSAANRLDQVDLVDFCLKLDSAKAKALAEKVQNAVKYNRAKGVADAHGLSLYFPNSNLRYMNAMSQIYDEIEMDEAFAGSVRQYATMESAGQITSNSSGSSLFDLLTGGQYYNYTTTTTRPATPTARTVSTAAPAARMSSTTAATPSTTFTTCSARHSPATPATRPPAASITAALTSRPCSAEEPPG